VTTTESQTTNTYKEKPLESKHERKKQRTKRGRKEEAFTSSGDDSAWNCETEEVSCTIDFSPSAF
jgi:hypothetical protein